MIAETETQKPVLTLVVPTRNESSNVFPLVDRVQMALSGIVYWELLFVDDSDDDTPRKIQSEMSWDKRIGMLHRDKSQRNGLAGAVVDGIAFARGRFVVVMDADLQHPPELLPDIYYRLMQGADMVIPSRFVPGGSDGGLVGHRKLVSLVARKLGQLAIPMLRKVTDPTGGYFAFDKSIIDGAKLDPVGWKILIEIIARGKPRNITEIPYQFADRLSGESKMSTGEQFNYIRHLWRLAGQVSHAGRFIKFGLVGLSGVVVNLGILRGILPLMMSPPGPFLASGLAAIVAMFWNYAINRKWTWAGQGSRPRWIEASLYFSVSLLGIASTASIFDALYPHIFTSPYAAQAIGVALSSVWTYMVHNAVTFNNRKGVIKHVPA